MDSDVATDSLVERARRRLVATPGFVQACRNFLLASDHPALRRSMRSRHSGGTLELEVLRLLGRRGVDPRLKHTWQWILPLTVVWFFVLLVVFGVVPHFQQYHIHHEWERDPLVAYGGLSRLFAWLMAAVILMGLPLNASIGALVVRRLRDSAEWRDLALSVVSPRELTAALWMRVMVCYRIFEIMGALTAVNYFGSQALVAWRDASMPSGLPTEAALFCILYTIGILGARIGALEGLIAGFLEMPYADIARRIFYRCLLHYLCTALIASLLLPLLPVLFLILIVLGLVDYPALYLIVGKRDFDRLCALMEPSTITEGIGETTWSEVRPRPLFR